TCPKHSGLCAKLRREQRSQAWRLHHPPTMTFRSRLGAQEDRKDGPAGVKLLSLAAVASIAILGCSKVERTTTTVPTPVSKIVYVIVTPTSAPSTPDYRATVSAAAGPPEPTPRPTVVSQLVPPTPAERLYFTVEDFLVRPPDTSGAVWFDGEVKN